MKIKSLQSKIFILVVSLFTAVLILNVYSVFTAARKQAELLIEARLNVGKKVVIDELLTDQKNFDLNVGTIAQDWGFRQALGQQTDTESLINIMQNHIQRISGDFAFVTDLNMEVIASTSTIDPSILQQLQHEDVAPSTTSSISLALLNNKPFYISSSTVKAPIEIGYIFVGKVLDSSIFTRLEEQIDLGISLVKLKDNGNSGVFSTMPSLLAAQNDNKVKPFSSFSSMKPSDNTTQIVEWNQKTYIAVSFPLNTGNSHSAHNQLIMVLHDSLSEAMSSLNRFWVDIVPFFFVGILVALIGAFVIARSITTPVTRLLNATRYVANGNYSKELEIKQSGELGELIHEFKNMQTAIVARENEIKKQSLALQENEKIKFEAEIAHKERELAEEATKTKSQFLASMSHEIRTPLTSIIGFSETLKNRNIPNKDKNSAIETINRCGNHLLNVINDILDVSKIEARKIELEVIDTPLLPLIDEVRQLADMLASNKDINFHLELQFPLPKYIATDPTRVKQVLINLVSNAIKFTESGNVNLEISFNTKAQTLIFSVLDTGIGMSSEQISRLFSAFDQADTSTTRKFGGTGLGLYICDQLSSLLGGKIQVTSQLNVGSEFQLTLPYTQTNDVTLVSNLSDANDLFITQASQAEIPTLSGKVLYADDNEDNRRLVSYLIKQTGAKAIIVENGEQAVEQALANEIDLILMDMQMPEMDGLEATEMLKSLGFSKPIIMMTANIDKDSIEQCVASGADDHFGKPIDTQKFHLLLSKHLTHDINHNVEKLSDLDDYDEMVNQFLAGLTDTLHNLTQAHHLHDKQTMLNILHQIKGSAGSFGYQNLTNKAAKLENEIHSQNEENTEKQMNYFLTQIKQIIEGNQ